MGPFSHIAVSMLCASRSPVTPLPATPASRRHRPSPPCGRSLRDGPVLKKLGAIVKDPSQAAFVDQLLWQRDRRHAPVVVPDHVRHARRLHRLHHGFALPRRCAPAASRTSPSCPPSAAAMAISAWVSLGLAMSIRSISATRPACASRSQTIGSPSSPRMLPPASRCGRKSSSAPAGTEVEEMAPAEGIGMGAAHEAVADHADVESFLAFMRSNSIRARCAPRS